MKSGFVGREFCSILSSYDRFRNRTRTPETEGYVLHEQRMYATHNSGAKRKMAGSFVLMGSEIDEEDDM